MIDVMLNAIDIAIDNATRLQTRKADLLIAPELSAYNRTDRERIPELIREGHAAARKTLSSIGHEILSQGIAIQRSISS